MVRFTATTILILLTVVCQAAEEGHHEYPYNVLALVIGHAEERLADGHAESGRMLGVEYERHWTKHWGWGVVIEQEAFGDSANRHAILAFPISYFPGGNWRLFGAPGVEFLDADSGPDQPLLRLGASYSFPLGERFAMSPEFQIDFLPAGDRVYVLGVALSYIF